MPTVSLDEGRTVVERGLSAVKEIRAAAVLTNAYVAADTIEAGNYKKIIVYVDFTKGSLTSLDIKAEWADTPGGTFRAEPTESNNAGVITSFNTTWNYTADANRPIKLSVQDRFLKISAIGNGTLTGSSLTLTAKGAND